MLSSINYLKVQNNVYNLNTSTVFYIKPFILLISSRLLYLLNQKIRYVLRGFL
jgi:hypothetical protein